MGDDPFQHLQNPKRVAVTAALTAAFGSPAIDSAVPLSGGISGASLFRVTRGARCCVLRVEGTPSPLRNPYQYESQRIAAEAGIAPKLYYADEAQGVTAMDFIAARPLREYPGGPRALAQARGELLRRVQATPVFPVFVDYPDIVGRLFAHVVRTGLFAPGLLDAHTARLAQIAQDNPWNPAALVSSHNDPNPHNILFDGERLWLIDWESAYRNDPLVDVAIMLDNQAPELEDVLLHAWLGRAPDNALRARLALIRSLTRLYYAGVLLSASATMTRAAPDGDLSIPTVAGFLAGPLGAQAVHILGKMYLSAFLTGDPVPPLDSL